MSDIRVSNWEDAMAFVPIPDGVEVLIQSTLQGEKCYNTLYYTLAGSWGTAEMQALADELDIVWGGFVAAWMPSTYTYERVLVTDKRSEFAAQVTADGDAGDGGLTGGAVVPNNCAIAVARRAGLTGRSTRGRVYVPVANTLLLGSDNTITTTFRDAVVDVFQAMDAAALTVDWIGVIVSRVQSGVPLTTAVVFTIAEWLVTDLVLDSMRRRLPGRGT